MRPGRTSRSTLSLATSVPNVLVTWRSWSSGPVMRLPRWAQDRMEGAGPMPGPHIMHGWSADRGRNGDLAVGDLLGVVGDLRLHVRRDDVAVVGEGEANATVLQTVGRGRAVGQSASVSSGDGRVDAVAHVLQHRGQDEALVELVLVRVDADRVPTGVLGSLEHACASATSDLVDDVSLVLLVHRLGDRVALVGVGEVADVADLDLDGRVDGLDALLEAHDEVVDDRDVHAADEADDLGPGRVRELVLARGGESGQHAREVRALVLLERDGGDVRSGHDIVVDDVLLVRVLGCDLLEDVDHLRRTDDDDVPPVS